MLETTPTSSEELRRQINARMNDLKGLIVKIQNEVLRGDMSASYIELECLLAVANIERKSFPNT